MLSNTFPDMTELDWERRELSHHMNWLRNQIDTYSILSDHNYTPVYPEYLIQLKRELTTAQDQMAILDTFK